MGEQQSEGGAVHKSTTRDFKAARGWLCDRPMATLPALPIVPTTSLHFTLHHGWAHAPLAPTVLSERPLRSLVSR
jgi:hypothetical protein